METLSTVRYKNRFVNGYKDKSTTRYLDTADYTLTVSEVLGQIPGESNEAFGEVIEYLLELFQNDLKPICMWQRVSIKTLAEKSAQLNSLVMEDEYLAKRLKKTAYADIFYVKINDRLWEGKKRVHDKLEEYLYGYIMSATLNKAFELTVKEIAAAFPKGSRLEMDNPGLTNGWKLVHQKRLIELLYNKPFARISDVLINKSGYFENAYSLTGLIYSSGLQEAKENENRESVYHFMTAKELVHELYKSAGIY